MCVTCCVAGLLRVMLCTSPTALSASFICLVQILSAHFTAAATNSLWRDSSIFPVLTTWLTTMTRVPASLLAAPLSTHTNFPMEHTERDVLHMLYTKQINITKARHTSHVRIITEREQLQSLDRQQILTSTVIPLRCVSPSMHWVCGNREEEGVHVGLNKGISEVNGLSSQSQRFPLQSNCLNFQFLWCLFDRS